jgi:N-acetylmuramoyl-L-alanine amidase
VKERPAKPALVTGIRAWSNPDYTRVVITLDRQVEFEHEELPADHEAGLPPRIFIDLRDAHLAPGVKDLPIDGGLLHRARLAQYQKDVVRVVLDTGSIKDFTVVPLDDPFRVIIDVRGERQQEISRLEPTIQTLPTQEPPVVTQPVTVTKIRRIVIDPGHGGKDSGALGGNGGMEKDVVLVIALKLAAKLKEGLGVDVVMTRSTDVFIPLDERTAIANKVNADLFVSVHANASLNREAEGVETYYLNLAKTDKAAQVAARENNTSLEKVSLLQAILFDLMANYKINDSAHLADEVQRALHRRVGKEYDPMRNNGVKQGPFYVLVGATMPSILVEAAFISNPREERLLKDRRFQEVTAEGIYDGIKGYVASMH